MPKCISFEHHIGRNYFVGIVFYNNVVLFQAIFTVERLEGGGGILIIKKEKKKKSTFDFLPHSILWN